MALLVFPTSPLNGQLYPSTPLPGQNQYQWDSVAQTWKLLGPAVGVSAGTYGSGTQIPVITVSAQGLVTDVITTIITPATTSSTGVVQPSSTYFEVTGSGVLSPSDSGVIAGSYTYPSILVDSKGRIISISSLPVVTNITVTSPIVKSGTASVPNISVQAASTSNSGVVTLVNNTSTNDPTKALTAAAGFNLQQQIDTITNIETITVTPPLTKTGTAENPILGVSAATTFASGVVQLVNDTTTNDITKALTASAGFSLQQQIDALVAAPALTFAGAINGSTGNITTVTPDGTAAGFVVGLPLPAPALALESYFVIVTTPGTFTPTGGASTSVVDGDWLVCIGSSWVKFALGATTSYVQFDDISSSFDGILTSFPLTIGGSAYAPTPSSNIMVFLGGVAQIPGPTKAYIVAGSTITFFSAPAADTSFYATTIAST